MDNLKAHINVIIGQYGLPVVVAVNKFSTDTDRELQLVCKVAKESGAFDACVADHWALGGEGAVDLAKAVIKVTESVDSSKFRFTYDLNQSIEVRNDLLKIKPNIKYRKTYNFSQKSKRLPGIYTALKTLCSVNWLRIKSKLDFNSLSNLISKSIFHQKLYESLGFGKLAICMAKTHLSLSHDPNLKGIETKIPKQ